MAVQCEGIRRAPNGESAMEIFLRKVSGTVWAHRLQAAARSTECSDPRDWLRQKVLEMGISTYNKLKEMEVFDMALVYKFGVDYNERGEFLGANGEHTNELKLRQEDCEEFWEKADFDNSLDTDILLLGMHGSDLSDREKLVPTLEFMFEDLTAKEVLDLADEVQELIESIPGSYDNPLLTYNAAAVDGIDHPFFGELFPDIIVIGDGILQFLDAIGLRNEGPDFVYAHEYGHHMQYEANIKPFQPSNAEESRRSELMADAFGAYYLSHDSGGNMVPDQIRQLHETAFSTGDCAVDNDGHHGTPLQRECAAIWGASVGVVANRETVLHPTDFLTIFDAVLPDIISLREDVCTLIVEEPSASPTSSPSILPSALPTSSPTGPPTAPPTSSPTGPPTAPPTLSPTDPPTALPTSSPTQSPSSAPTSPKKKPSSWPSTSPNLWPTGSPTTTPTATPSKSHTASPTSLPTAFSVPPTTFPTAPVPTSESPVKPFPTPTPRLDPAFAPKTSQTSPVQLGPQVDLPSSGCGHFLTEMPTSLLVLGCAGIWAIYTLLE